MRVSLLVKCREVIWNWDSTEMLGGFRIVRLRFFSNSSAILPDLDVLDATFFRDSRAKWKDCAWMGSLWGSSGDLQGPKVHLRIFRVPSSSQSCITINKVRDLSRLETAACWRTPRKSCVNLVIVAGYLEIDLFGEWLTQSDHLSEAISRAEGAGRSKIHGITHSTRELTYPSNRGQLIESPTLNVGNEGSMEQ